MPDNCPQLHKQYQELAKLREEFALAFKEGENTRNFSQTLKLEEQIITLIKEIREKLHVSIKQAKEIFDTPEMKEQGITHVLGPAEIAKAFKMKLENIMIPQIPFSKKELIRAQELGQFLILRINIDDQGQPLTMKGLSAMMLRNGYPEELDKDGQPKGKITYSEDYGNEDWWTGDQIEMRWALVDKEIIKDSTNKDYHEQTRLLKEYINKIFQDEPMPAKYQEAIKEFDDYVKKEFSGQTDNEINKIIGGSNWKKYAEELANLKLNDLLRKTPAEELYDELLYFQNNSERLNENIYNWTKRLYSGGSLVGVGVFDSNGSRVYGWRPGHRRGDLGVSSSRS